MSPAKRQCILVGLLLVMLTGAAAWNVGWMLEQKSAARIEARHLRDAEEIAADIDALRSESAVASTEDIDVQELGQRIATASSKSGLPTTALEGVFPQSSRRVADTPYLTKPTALSLREVTLSELATFLYHLTDGTGLAVRDLRLRTPRGRADFERWDVEATVTYLLYDPGRR
jgi:hypothetical protein